MINFIINNIGPVIQLGSFFDGCSISVINKKALQAFKKLYTDYNDKIFLLNGRVNEYFEIRKGVLYLKKDVHLMLDYLKKLQVLNVCNLHDLAIIHDTHNAAFNRNNAIHFLTRRVSSPFECSSVLFKSGSYSKIFGANNLIIIENKKIFDLDDLSIFFNKFDFEISENDLIMFGNGNMICASRIPVDFFKQFSGILYFGDYDSEGYEIFKRFFSLHGIGVFMMPLADVMNFIQSKMDEPLVCKNRAVGVGLLGECSLKSILKVKYEMQQEVFLY